MKGTDLWALTSRHFLRPSLPGCPSKQYHPLEEKAIPAVIICVVGPVGNLNGQRPALPRDFLRVEPQDGSETRLQTLLIEQVVQKLKEEEASIFDAGFKLKELHSTGLKQYVIRLPNGVFAMPIVFAGPVYRKLKYKNICRKAN